MESIELTQSDFRIPSLGTPSRRSPLGLSNTHGDYVADYVCDDESVLYYTDRKTVVELVKAGKEVHAFEKAGPRETIYFDPAKTKIAIVTCGGLCPGINNVIRSLVMEHYYRYGVKTIYGIRYGYMGFIPRHGVEPYALVPDGVKDIHTKGGSILASSRGEQDIGEIVDFLANRGISILYTIGGDGTIRGAHRIYDEITKRGLDISVIAIPKTIDNDIMYVEKTFGLETAFSVAGEAILAAHTEAIGAPNGIGLVKVMGRGSGFIAANAALALNEVNFVLVPEIPFDLEGPKGLFTLLEARLIEKKHAVLVVAEGAGQEYASTGSGKTDASGNVLLGDIGVYLKNAFSDHFKKTLKMEVNLKYIDPSYLVRAVAANAHDAIFCMQLAQNATHAGMAGKTGILIGMWNDNFTHVPFTLATSRSKRLSPEDALWLSVIEATGQPFIMKNSDKE
jgi:6-phosphofructokinase 1